MENQKPKETFLSRLYRKRHPGEEPPYYYYYYYYSLGTILAKPVRKWFSAVFIPSIPFANLRVVFYRWCGYKIGKNVFIGMRCYLDDMCAKLIEIEDNVIISYGVFFACHGRNQGHNPIRIKEGAYIGMNCSLIARQEEGLVIGKNAVIGACSMVNKSIPDNATAVGTPAKVIATAPSAAALGNEPKA